MINECKLKKINTRSILKIHQFLENDTKMANQIELFSQAY